MCIRDSVVLVPAFLRANRRLAALPVDPIEVTETTAIPIVGPTDGSMVVDAVVTASMPIIAPQDTGRGRGRRRGESARGTGRSRKVGTRE